MKRDCSSSSIHIARKSQMYMHLILIFQRNIAWMTLYLSLSSLYSQEEKSARYVYREILKLYSFLHKIKEKLSLIERARLFSHSLFPFPQFLFTQKLCTHDMPERCNAPFFICFFSFFRIVQTTDLQQ